MGWPEKWTARRGRCGVPATFLRRRRCRMVSGLGRDMLLNGFAFLANDLLARVTDTLALVRFGRVIAADIRRHLSDKTFVDSFDLHLGILSHGDFDSLGNGKKNV